MGSDKNKRFFFAKRYWKSKLNFNSNQKLPGKLDPELESEWGVWRLVLEKVATLEEINSSWNFLDIIKMNALLDMKIDIEKDAIEKSKKRKK